ncbi:MAG: hypothetical protein ABIR10_17005, partial [Dokdonella sp.]
MSAAADKEPQPLESTETIDDGMSASAFNRATVKTVVRLEPAKGDWEAPAKPEPLPPITTNRYLRDLFAAESNWLKNRQELLTKDIARMNGMIASGGWESQQRIDWDDGSRERNANERIRNGMARDFIRTHRLRGMIAGATTQETERDMVHKVLGENEDATLPTPLQILALKERARADARQAHKVKAWHAHGIHPGPDGTVNDVQAAIYLKTSVRQLYRWREAKTGPAYIR